MCRQHGLLLLDSRICVYVCLQRSCLRNMLMHVFHLLVYVLLVRGIKDTQCGFKLMTRSAAVALYNSLHINRWSVPTMLEDV